MGKLKDHYLRQEEARRAEEEKSSDTNEAECVVPLANGGSIRSPAYPKPCSYVRVCAIGNIEIGYWSSDEWREDPEVVMGAIVGAMRSTVQ